MLFSIAVLACLAVAQTTGVGEGLAPDAAVPDFTVLNMDGRPTTYSMLRGQVVVVTFISTRCPISNAFNKRMNDLYLAFADRVRFLFVYSNANESMDEVRAHSKAVEYDFPVYKDKEGAAAELLGATATPDAFVIDAAGILRYHGYIEDAPNPDRVKNRGLQSAIEATLEGKAIPASRTRAFGCAIRRARPHVP